MLEKKISKNLLKAKTSINLLGIYLYLFSTTVSFAAHNNFIADNSKHIIQGTFSTPTNATGQNVFTLPVKITAAQAPIITLSNNINSGIIMRIIWICTSSVTAAVTTVFNVIKNGVLSGNTNLNWYSSYFITAQLSKASLNTTASGITQGTQVLSFFTAGNSSNNLMLLNNDVILLAPGEIMTLAASTISGSAIVDVSLTWQEFRLSNNN